MFRMLFAPIIKSTTAVYSHRVFLSVENRSFSIKRCGGLFSVDLCVFVFLISCDIYVLACVIESVLVLRGLRVDVWFLCG
jgi:hypothetical protein